MSWESWPTTNGAAAAPKITDTMLNAPKPAPRRCAGTASATPARSPGIASQIVNMPTSSSANESGNGIGKYDDAKSVTPIAMQYAGITTRAPRMRVA